MAARVCCLHFPFKLRLHIAIGMQTRLQTGVQTGVSGVYVYVCVCIYTVFQKKFTLLLFAITKSYVDRFQ